METLFTTTLPNSINYHVSFYEDAYHFEAAGDNKSSFAVKRENDMWKSDDGGKNELFSAATAALDKYLLSQH